MRIAIGTTSRAELEATEEAWKVFSASIFESEAGEAQFLSYGVSSGVPAMPLTVDDLMLGAQGRAENLILQLKREKTEADFYIGLQSGFSVVDSLGPRRLVFLESWAYVSDGHRGCYGHGGGIAVPHRIADPVIDRGIDLSIVMDRFSKEQELRSNHDCWRMLTKQIIDLQHSFVIALIGAFAPFYNLEAYS